MTASSFSAMAPRAMRIAVAPRMPSRIAGRFCCARQAGDRHADHDGVVAGQRDVDQDDLRQGGEVVRSVQSGPSGSPLSATGATV